MFNWLKKKAPKTEKKTYTPIGGGQQQLILQRGDFLQFALGYGFGVDGYQTLTYQDAMSFYRSSNAVATSVDIISQELSRIKPVIKSNNGEITYNSPVLDLLNDPNPWNETFSFFIESISKSYLLTGDTFIYGGGIITRPPIELYSLKPQNVEVTAGNNDYRPINYQIYAGDGPGNYKRSRANNGIRFYDGNLKELWHIRKYSSTAENIKGDSPLEAACLDVKNQLKTKIHNIKFFDNGARPSLLVAFKDTLTSDQHTERRDLINEQLAGVDNAGKVAVISSTDMDLKELGVSNKDMDYENLEKISEHAVFKRYRVPLPLVSVDATTLNNLKVAVYHLFDFAVLPAHDELFSSLSMFLLPRFGLDPAKQTITYNPDDIEAIKERRVESLVKRKELGIETINEMREGLANRDDIAGGDVLYQNANLIPLGTDVTGAQDGI